MNYNDSPEVAGVSVRASPTTVNRANAAVATVAVLEDNNVAKRVATTKSARAAAPRVAAASVARSPIIAVKLECNARAAWVHDRHPD